MLLIFVIAAIFTFLFLMWWLAGSNNSSDHLQAIRDDLDSVCEELNIKPKYDLYESSDHSFTDHKEQIYLVVWNSKKSEYFDMNTIMLAALHELAHILCSDKGHSPRFDQIEKKLQEATDKIGIIDLNLDPHPDYPYRD